MRSRPTRPTIVLATCQALCVASLSACAFVQGPMPGERSAMPAPALEHQPLRLRLPLPPDPAGLIERILAGNIDQKGSPAYNRWGLGFDEGLAASDRKFTLPR